jgi:hypothetical protein
MFKKEEDKENIKAKITVKSNNDLDEDGSLSSLSNESGNYKI